MELLYFPIAQFRNFKSLSKNQKKTLKCFFNNAFNRLFEYEFPNAKNKSDKCANITLIREAIPSLLTNKNNSVLICFVNLFGSSLQYEFSKSIT